MKITRGEDANLGRILYNLEPQEYDGIPLVKQLWIDGRVLRSFPDHVCIAEAVLFHGYVSGPLTLSTNCMPSTARSLQLFFAPRFVPMTNVLLAPREPPFGGQTVVVGRAKEDAAGFLVELASPARFRTIFDMDRASFASNLRSLLRSGEPETNLALALAILFSGDLDLRRIIVDRSDLPMYGVSALLALQSALRGVNIDLDIRNADLVAKRAG